MQLRVGATESTLERPLFFQAEAAHRIANSLQIISSIVRQRAKSGAFISDPRSYLLEVADRIETVGKLHWFISRSTGENVELASFLKEICDRLTGALAPDAASLAFDFPADCPLRPEKALRLGLITAELVSNSLKYAHPAGLPVKIALSCKRDQAGELTFLYEDDGVGFPEDFEISGANHLGMRLVRLLSAGIGGDPKWQSDPLGVRFELALANIN